MLEYRWAKAIITNILDIKRAAAKIAKQFRMDIFQEMLTTFNDDPDLLKKVITGVWL